MKKSIFQKYEILRNIYLKQDILMQHTRGISVKEIKNVMRKGDIKLIYDICNNNAKAGLLEWVGGKGWDREYKITTNGINRIKWLMTQKT